MKEFLSATRVDYKEHDAFVCCILTHGNFGTLAGIDGSYVEITDMLAFFTGENCPDLRGKPKLFFIQACQGNKEQKVYDADTESDAGCGIGEAVKGTLPNDADFLLSYATVPGYVSYRSKTKGSWFISTLVDVLNTHYKNEDLMSILTCVNDKLSDKANKDEGQVPAPISTLRRKVFFHQ